MKNSPFSKMGRKAGQVGALPPGGERGVAEHAQASELQLEKLLRKIGKRLEESLALDLLFGDLTVSCQEFVPADHPVFRVENRDAHAELGDQGLVEGVQWRRHGSISELGETLLQRRLDRLERAFRHQDQQIARERLLFHLEADSTQQTLSPSQPWVRLDRPGAELREMAPSSCPTIATNALGPNPSAGGSHPRKPTRHLGGSISTDEMLDLTEAKRILAAFEREGVQYVMVGSMAMAAQGLVRATRHVDFFVSPTAANVEAVRRALKGLFQNDPNVDEIRAEDLAGDYPAIQYVPLSIGTSAQVVLSVLPL
jgi:hypothetical protein